MAAVVVICAGLLGFSPTDRSEYQAAATRAARDAGAQLKLAVWCEAHGMDAERLKHLAEALAIDPQNAAARGMMGLVSYGGRWLPPEKVGEAVKADEPTAAKLAEYEAKRQATPETAEAQWQLGLWCEKNGLKAEAMAHFTAVTQIDPYRVDAWRKLGCEWSNGRWIHADQAAADRAEAEAQRKADMHWEPILIKWKNAVGFHGPEHDRAVAALDQITDPRAVPSIHRVLARGGRAQQEMAVQMLSLIDCPASSHSLVALSLFESWPEGRSFAIGVLKRRDPRDFMDELIGLMHRPFAYHINPAGPNGEPASLVIDGDKTRIQRDYRPYVQTTRRGRLHGYMPVDAGRETPAIGQDRPAAIDRFLPDRTPAQLTQMAAFGQRAGQVVAQARGATQQTLQRDLAIVEKFNLKIRGGNEIVGETLREITGQRLGDDPDVWLAWWNDKLGLRYERTEPRYKETTVQAVPVRFTLHHSCFVAGTPVSTLTGLRPIESLKLGDVVLSQDTETGVLGFQPVLGVHHNPPAETLRVRLKDETVVCTPVHRFWRPGRGWAMARDLKPGDSIRTVGGRTEIVEIRPEIVQPVFNLDVDRTHSFFVGTQKFLVRDNSLPPAMSTPFDAEPALAAIAEEPAGPSHSPDAENPLSGAAEDAVEPGSVWGSAGESSSPRKSSMLGPPMAVESGSIWEPGSASTTRGAAPRP